MIINQNQILHELGITKDVNIKNLDELLEEMQTEGTLLYLVVNSDMFIPCFPPAHMSLQPIEDVKDAYVGKGHEDYYNYILNMIDNMEDDDTIYSGIPSPVLGLLEKGTLPNLETLNKLDYTHSCSRETTCPLIRTYGKKIYGRPCPVIIYKFLLNLSVYTEFVYNYLSTFEDEYSSVDDLKSYHIAMIITNARIKTMDEFLSDSKYSNKLTITEGELSVGKDINFNNLTSVDSTIFSNFKSIGIDIIDLNKIKLKATLNKKGNLAANTDVLASFIPSKKDSLTSSVILNIIKDEEEDI